MAEYQEVIKHFNRMCDSHKFCDACEINDARATFTCYRWLTENPTRAEEIILKWAKENPLMTNRMKFKEVFGFEFTVRVPESQYHREWLNREYKEP